MHIDIVEWKGTHRHRLLGRARPTLFVIGDDELVPVFENPLHDWVRSGTDPDDIEARVTTLRARAASSEVPLRARVEEGVVETEAGSAVLSPLESALLDALLERRDRVVGRERLMRHVWPDQTGDRNRLDAVVHRLRRRVGPIGLDVRTVRGRGYMVRLVEP